MTFIQNCFFPQYLLSLHECTFKLAVFWPIGSLNGSYDINNIFNFELILESKKALQLYEEADKKVQDLERAIYDLQRQISNDFGPENEFAALNGQCYDFIDLNYKYQLCLFEKVIK